MSTSISLSISRGVSSVMIFDAPKMISPSSVSKLKRLFRNLEENLTFLSLFGDGENW